MTTQILNAIPTLPDPGREQKASTDPANQSGDAFASLLGSLWFAPLMNQTPAPPTDASPTVTRDAPGFVSLASTPAMPIQPGADVPLSANSTTLAKSSVPVPPTPSDNVAVDLPPASSTADNVAAAVAPTAQLPVNQAVNQVQESKGTQPIVHLPQTPTDTASTPNAQPVVAQLVTLASTQPPTPKPVEINLTGLANNPAPIPESGKASTGGPTDQVSPPVIADPSSVQTLQTQAAQRDANLVAGYMAEAGRADHAANPLLAIRREFAGGSDFHSNDAKREQSTSGDDGNSQTTQINESFSSIVRDAGKVNVELRPTSVAAQTINYILASVNSLDAPQTRSLRLRLQPAELGQIDIQLTRDASGRISAHLTTQHDSAREALSQSLGQLRETLERAGLHVDRLQVKSDQTSLANNGTNDNAPLRNSKSPTTNARTLATTETEEPDADAIRDHKLVSLSA